MFLELYKTEIVDRLFKDLKCSNVMEVPRLLKIVLNMGIGEAVSDSKVVRGPMNDLALIAGQKPILTYAKKSIAAFKLRKDVVAGCKVTIRGPRMYEFLERLVYAALPRERDFKGFSRKQFDGNGNFSFGIKEHISFFEVDYDKVDRIWGLDVSIVTSSRTDDWALALLRAFNFPFYDFV